MRRVRSRLVLPLAFGLLASGAGVAAGQDAFARPRQLWAVIISIGQYKDSKLAERPGLPLDGRSLARWVTGTAGWPSDHVLELNDDGDPRPGPPAELAIPLLPTRANLDWGLRAWLGHRARRGDVVLIAFAGRAARTSQGELLLPIEANTADLARDGWSPEPAIAHAIGNLKCSEVLCWIDAPLLAHPTGIPGEPAAGGRLLDRLARWPGASVWWSTDDRRANDGRGSAFASALRSALGERPRPLLATLSDLERREAEGGLGFRQRGGVPADLSLARDRLAASSEHRATLLVQGGHAGRITSIAVSPDGRTMFTGSEDSTIRVWRRRAGEPSLIRVLPDFLNGVTTLTLSPDGRYLVGGGGLGEVLVWDLAQPDSGPIALAGPRPHVDRIISLAFLPAEGDGTTRRFVSLGQNGRCTAWEIAGRALKPVAKPLLASGGVAIAVASSPSSNGSAALVIGVGDGGGKLRLFDRAARPGGELPIATTGPPTALHVSLDGRWVALGDDSGRVRLNELSAGGRDASLGPFPGPIGAIRFGPGGRLAIGTRLGLQLGSIDRPDPLTRLAGVEDEIARIEFSADGRWLVAATAIGSVHLWKIDTAGRAGPVKLEGLDGREGAACLAFGPSSGSPFVAVGSNDGTVRRWDLETLKEHPALSPHRGKVRRLAPSPDGRFLIQINDDGIAQLWDLREGRNVRTLAGLWSAATFLPDGRLAMARHPDVGGWIALVDPKSGRLAVGSNFARPVGVRASVPTDFSRIAASRDGRRVAAMASPGRTEVVLVWDMLAATCRAIAGHDRPLTAIDFSSDGRWLLTAAEDGKVLVHDLDPPDGRTEPVVIVHDEPLKEISAARFIEGKFSGIVAAGSIDANRNAVLAWPWNAALSRAGDHLKPRRLGEIEGQVKALAVLGEGRYLAAAGQGRRLRLWDLADPANPADLEIRVDPARSPSIEPHHFEQVNDLIAWPRAGGVSFVTGSDDTTIRFWNVDPKGASLLGTLTTAPEAEGADVPARPGHQPDGPRDAPWAAFTPQGVYDGSQGGDGMVTFVTGEEVRPLSQYAERLFHPLLTDQLRRGVCPAPKAFSPPPPLVIAADEDQGDGRPETDLTVALGDSGLKPEDLRLYQNDVPVRDGSGFRPGPRSGEFVARVRLVPGENRFYAMVGRAEDVDARSGDLLLHHAGPASVGRLHIMALGVGEYRRNALKYPVRDADDLATFLQRQGLASGHPGGKTIVLTDREVNEKGVEQAFETIRKDVQGHPEDTVVVFLAGHTDILADTSGRSRFSLLLPEFPFSADAPPRAVLRGSGIASAVGAPPASTFLPYQTLYKNLIHLDALQRLIIVDACQAEAVIDDPGVRRLEQLQAMDREARRVRTAYLLASRRGEAAVESPVLKHGLLTYVVLRGMGAPGLEPLPDGPLAIRDQTNADQNGDGRITTSELRRYIDDTLPELAERLPGKLRAAGGERGALAPPATLPARVQAGGVSFPLIVLPPRP